MAYTQAQLDALQVAISTGARSIAYDGKSTTFRNLSDMLALEARITAYLSGTTTSRSNLASVSKGTR